MAWGHAVCTVARVREHVHASMLQAHGSRHCRVCKRPPAALPHDRAHLEHASHGAQPRHDAGPAVGIERGRAARDVVAQLQPQHLRRMWCVCVCARMCVRVCVCCVYMGAAGVVEGCEDGSAEGHLQMRAHPAPAPRVARAASPRARACARTPPAPHVVVARRARLHGGHEHAARRALQRAVQREAAGLARVGVLENPKGVE